MKAYYRIDELGSTSIVKSLDALPIVVDKDINIYLAETTKYINNASSSELNEHKIMSKARLDLDSSMLGMDKEITALAPTIFRTYKEDNMFTIDTLEKILTCNEIKVYSGFTDLIRTDNEIILTNVTDSLSKYITISKELVSKNEYVLVSRHGVHKFVGLDTLKLNSGRFALQHRYFQ